MLYFSYGSNMSMQRLSTRITGFSNLGIATLCRHDLRFHKVSKNNGGGKCDIFKTNDPKHFVLGVVYRIDPIEKPELDRFEGLGSGYEEKQVSIEMNGKIISAFTYYATNIKPELKPLNWYKEHVVRGARENELPEEYIQQIEIVESFEDEDGERHQRELAIYG